MKYHTFFSIFKKMSQNLSSAAVVTGALRVKSFLACRLLITFASSLVPDQGQ